MRPLQMLIKPASSNCNLNCRYCFYCDEGKNRENFSYGFMSEETLEILVKKAFEYADGFCGFAFQGGEPTLVGLPFFERLIELQKKYNKNHIQVDNSIQTNGYGLTEEWAEFFAREKFLVGLSLDGIKSTHDAYRVTRKGEGSFAEIMKTAQLFDRFGVEYNILTVVNGKTGLRAAKIYDFYKKNNFRYLQFIACLDPIGQEPGKQPYSLTPEVYGRFLMELFDRWYDDVEKGEQPYIRQFENVVGVLSGYEPESCEQRGICSVQNVIEADGSVYPCDFYALDEYRLGNVAADDFFYLQANPVTERFVRESAKSMESCRTCPYFRICRGGCRRNRITLADGSRKNYFCSAYRMFYEYSLERFLRLAGR
ncbi:MAG TPA: anaerobic sulfatase maturase [Candidatus Lachnoclostridium pullistercoris]|uniref:Anaerobic sulfatase maturase n=1 Tax=Candidatus Lachnoclostridium pullistercoris TaxID=2838632 RepID=A0A9D2PCS7_9FIRM|nr:anaerobic sulfatase maturase [Candidatus Lachnoclostridium pullistercoris]